MLKQINGFDDYYVDDTGVYIAIKADILNQFLNGKMEKDDIF